MIPDYCLYPTRMSDNLKYHQFSLSMSFFSMGRYFDKEIGDMIIKINELR